MFNKIEIKQFSENPFTMIGEKWMIISAANKGKVNGMTASWGGMGIMWHKNVVNIVIRPQRYTKEFVDASETFSLSFFNNEYRKTLAYFGKVSGRDEDKIAASGLNVEYELDTPYYKEAETVVICKKIFAQPYVESSFIDKKIVSDCYPSKDFHTLYYGEILSIMSKK